MLLRLSTEYVIVNCLGCLLAARCQHFVRVLIYFYVGNFVRVQLCGIVSNYFLSSNGVKQGGVLSPILLCLYIDGLLLALSRTLGASWAVISFAR